MESITIDRKEELQTIESALDILLDRKRLLRTPIVEFYGVKGIGKTTLLNEVARRCRQKNIEHIRLKKLDNAEIQFIRSTRELLGENKKGVVIIDSLDDASEDQLQKFEEGLDDLIKSRFLLVVFASTREKRFEGKRSISRKLTLFHLQSLSRAYCSEYLEQFEDDILVTTRNLIYDWTRGYPLAMDTMVDAITERKLKPDKPEDRQALLSLLVEKVIYQELLNKAGNDLPLYEKLITFLSVPRRFNLTITLDFINKFVQESKLESTMDFVDLPKNINKVAPVIYWNLQRSGFCVDDPVRNLFLLKLQHQDPTSYVEAHSFLANMNKTLASEVTGLDHIRYVEEYLYHFIMSGATSDELEQEIIATVQQLAKTNSINQLVQFENELLGDADISDALTGKTQAISSFIEQQIIALEESKGIATFQDNNVDRSDSSLPPTLSEER